MQKNFKTLLGQAKQVYYNLLDDLGIWINSCAVKLYGGKKIEIQNTEPREQRIVSVGNRREEYAPSESGTDMITAEQQEIAQWLKKTKFKTKFFMGADETDVWKKIAQLNRLYDKALLAERARYDALLSMYRGDEHFASDIGECEVENEHSDE